MQAFHHVSASPAKRRTDAAELCSQIQFYNRKICWGAPKLLITDSHSPTQREPRNTSTARHCLQKVWRSQTHLSLRWARGRLSGSSSSILSSYMITATNGVPLDKLVIGKPADATDASNGYMAPTALSKCVTQAKAKNWNAGAPFSYPPCISSQLIVWRAQG